MPLKKTLSGIHGEINPKPNKIKFFKLSFIRFSIFYSSSRRSDHRHQKKLKYAKIYKSIVLSCLGFVNNAI